MFNFHAGMYFIGSVFKNGRSRVSLVVHVHGVPFVEMYINHQNIINGKKTILECDSREGVMDDYGNSDGSVDEVLDECFSDSSVAPTHPSDDGSLDSDNEMALGGEFGDELIYVRPNQNRPSCDGLGIPVPEPWIQFADENAQDELDRDQRAEVEEPDKVANLSYSSKLQMLLRTSDTRSNMSLAIFMFSIFQEKKLVRGKLSQLR